MTVGKTLESFFVNSGDKNDPSVVKRLSKHMDQKIAVEFLLHEVATWRRWPSTHKNVFSWVILENGMAVACNENPGYGISYPSMKLIKQPLYRVSRGEGLYEGSYYNFADAKARVDANPGYTMEATKSVRYVHPKTLRGLADLIVV